MKFNRAFLRVASLGMIGSMALATPAYAQNTNGLAGIALLFQQNSAEAQGISGVATIDYVNEAYLNARNVMANSAAKYEMTEAEAEAQVELASTIDEAAEEKHEASPYDDIAISQVNSFVNVREAADEESDPVGKLYNNAAATILDTVEAEDGSTWYQIESGSVEGYVKSNYFVTGEDAEAIAFEVGRVKATVSTETLRLRSEASLDSETVTLLSEDERYDVLSQDDGFVKLKIDSDCSGYVASDYVTISVDFDKAISLEEEREAEEAQRLAEESIAAAEAEEEAERRAEEAAEEEEDEEEYDSEDEEEEVTYSDDDSEDEEEEEEEYYEEEEEDDDEDYESTSATREAIVDYALSFVGQVPYVWGGTSLSSGVDCSGFVQQVYKHFGISLPRTSADQGCSGYSVSSSDKQPGDLVYYGGHIAIYIGNGQVVHASNERTGIKVSTWNYRSYISIRNVID